MPGRIMSSVYRGILIPSLVALVIITPMLFARGNVEVGIFMTVLGVAGAVVLAMDFRSRRR